MKKLQISKETLASLNESEGRQVAAGMPVTLYGNGCSDVVCYSDACYTQRPLVCKTVAC